MLVGAAWSNLSLPAMCGCAAAAALLFMYLVSLGKRAAKCVLFVGGLSYYTYLAWCVYDFLPYFRWYSPLALCAWGFACDAAVEAATGSVWSGAVAAARKAVALVVNSFSSVAGNLRREGQQEASKVSSNDAPATAAAPSEPAAPAPVEAKQVKKGKVPAKKIKTPKACERAAVDAVNANVAIAVPLPPMKKTLEHVALALAKASQAFASVTEVVFTVVPVFDVLFMLANAFIKACEAFDSVMEIVFTVVPIFDVAEMALKLFAVAFVKACEAFDSVMEIVFTVVPIFDVADMVIRAALKLVVILAKGLFILAKGLCKASVALFKFVGNEIVSAVVCFLKKLFKPVLVVYGILKFVVYTAPRWVCALFR